MQVGIEKSTAAVNRLDVEGQQEEGSKLSIELSLRPVSADFSNRHGYSLYSCMLVLFMPCRWESGGAGQQQAARDCS